MFENSKIDGICIWFETHFQKNLESPVTFSTGPYDRPTHWKQTMMFVDGQFDLNEGDILEGTFAVRRNPKRHRELDIKVSFNAFDKESGETISE